MQESKAIPQVRRYAGGQLIEYTSFAPSGYSVGQVVRYAAQDEQGNPANRLVYIRTRSGGKPFAVRESQLRNPRYGAHFTPEAWVNEQAGDADPEGLQEWDCTEYARRNRDYLAWLEARGELLDQPGGAVDNDDLFKGDPAAPAWVRGWRGPFTIRITREPAGEQAAVTVSEPQQPHDEQAETVRVRVVWSEVVTREASRELDATRMRRLGYDPCDPESIIRYLKDADDFDGDDWYPWHSEFGEHARHIETGNPEIASVTIEP